MTRNIANIPAASVEITVQQVASRVARKRVLEGEPPAALVLAGLMAGWLAEAVSRAGGYGCIIDMALGLMGSVLLQPRLDGVARP